ncbi:MAG TPA: outer membrane protein assembly factor BamE [Hyphomicrobiaceae bacterium]|nr:outer membrane protein assembly factor BamE [Hyphomicrobiaceae bacterium]
MKAGCTNGVMRHAGRLRATAGSSLLAVTCAITLLPALAGCSPQIIKHGHQFRETDIQQIQPGMSQEQVKLQLGTPATTTTINNGQAYYYIASTMSQAAFLKEKEIDRKVLAVYFNPMGSVDHIAHYGMKDGKVFDYISRTTAAPGGKDDGILKQLFRNLGTRQLYGE